MKRLDPKLFHICPFGAEATQVSLPAGVHGTIMIAVQEEAAYPLLIIRQEWAEQIHETS